MNLPTEAKVTVNGLRSGIVTDIAAAPDTAKVTVRLDPSTVVGKHATVELRQDTLLGDTYVAITNPADAYSTPLARGGTIGKDQVKPAVQVEQLLSAVTDLDAHDRWQVQARLAIRDDLHGVLRTLTQAILVQGDATESPEAQIADWELRNVARIARVRTTIGQVRGSDVFEFASLSVAARALRSIAF